MSKFDNFVAFSESIAKELNRHGGEETIDVSITWGPQNTFLARTTWHAFYYNPTQAMEQRIARLEEELVKEKAKLEAFRANTNK